MPTTKCSSHTTGTLVTQPTPLPDWKDPGGAQLNRCIAKLLPYQSGAEAGACLLATRYAPAAMVVEHLHKSNHYVLISTSWGARP